MGKEHRPPLQGPLKQQSLLATSIGDRIAVSNNKVGTIHNTKRPPHTFHTLS